MLDLQRDSDRDTLINFYQLKTLNPTSYEKDTIVSFLDRDYSQEVASAIPKPIVNKLLSETTAQTKDRPTEVSRAHARTSADFRDALGFSENIKELLLDMDVIEDTRDPQLHKFMVDSKSFNPKIFLSTIHADKSLNDLKRGIQYLERDIEATKPELQQLITSNFEKTLTTKNSLDTVFAKYSKSDLASKVNQLESELASSSNSANQLLNPVLLQISKENQIASALKQIEENKEFLDLPKKISNLASQDKFDLVLEEYQNGQSLFIQMKHKYPNNLLYPKVWSKIEELINNYREKLLETLKSTPIESINDNFQNQLATRGTSFTTIIKKIILLGTDKSPIKEFVQSQFSRATTELENGFALIKYDRIVSARKGIINAYEMDQADNGEFGHIEMLANTTMNKIYNLILKPNFKPDMMEDLYTSLDLPLVSEIWGFVSRYVDDIIDNVIKKKVLKFESVYKFFINDMHTLLSKEIIAENSHMLDITEDDKLEMRVFFRDVLLKICGRMEFIFTCTNTGMDHALSLSLEYGKDTVLPEIEKDKPIDSTESFGFIPPHSNSITAVHYIVNMHNQIYNTLSSLNKKDHIFYSETLAESLHKVAFEVNKNMIYGSLCVLDEDMKTISLMENWSMSDINEGCTKFPEFMLSYYELFLLKLRKLKVSDDSPEVISKAIKLLLQSLSSAADSLVQLVYKRCHYDELQSEFYHLVTIANLKFIKKVTIPKILSIFDSSFNQSLHTSKNLEIYDELDSHEMELLTNCFNPYYTTIKEIMKEGVRLLPENSKDIKSRLENGKSIPVSPFILKIFGFVNSIKSKSSKWNASKLQRNELVTYLLSQFVKKFYDSLTAKYTSDAAAQLAIDIAFTKVVVSRFNSVSSYEVEMSKLESAFTTFNKSIDSKLLSQNIENSFLKNRVLVECILDI